MQAIEQLDANPKFALPRPGLRSRATIVAIVFTASVLMPLSIVYFSIDQGDLLNSDLFGTMLSASIGSFLGIVAFYFADPFGARFNFFSEKRARMIANIVSLAKEELVLSTGCLDSGVYSSNIVLEAFKVLPEKVSIVVLHRAPELSQESRELQEFLRSRSAKILHWGNFSGLEVPTDIIIADKKHIRIEFFAKRKESNSGNKFAIYLYDNLAIPPKYYSKFINPVFEALKYRNTV